MDEPENNGGGMLWPMAMLIIVVLTCAVLLIVAAQVKAAPLPWELRHPMTPAAAEAVKAGVEADPENPYQRARWRKDAYRKTLFFRFPCDLGYQLHCDDPDCPQCAACVYQGAKR